MMAHPDSDAPAALTHLDGSPLRVLVIDDEKPLADLVSMAFRQENWIVDTGYSVSDAVGLAKTHAPDLAILDVMLPDGDGLGLMRSLRGIVPQLPVVFLTAKDAVADRVEGLTQGGDDYVTKPFSLEELVARSRTVLRRSGHLQTTHEHSEIMVADLRLDEDSYEVFRGDQEISLTTTEFELLRYLMRNSRRVVSKDNILDHVWHYDFGGNRSIVEIYISYLRKKIDTLGPPLIHTVRGVGYIVKAPSGS